MGLQFLAILHIPTVLLFHKDFVHLAQWTRIEEVARIMDSSNFPQFCRYSLAFYFLKILAWSTTTVLLMGKWQVLRFRIRPWTVYLEQVSCFSKTFFNDSVLSWKSLFLASPEEKRGTRYSLIFLWNHIGSWSIPLPFESHIFLFDQLGKWTLQYRCHAAASTVSIFTLIQSSFPVNLIFL